MHEADVAYTLAVLGGKKRNSFIKFCDAAEHCSAY
jgi:hypothetical protein